MRTQFGIIEPGVPFAVKVATSAQEAVAEPASPSAAAGTPDAAVKTPGAKGSEKPEQYVLYAVLLFVVVVLVSWYFVLPFSVVWHRPTQMGDKIPRDEVLRLLRLITKETEAPFVITTQSTAELESSMMLLQIARGIIRDAIASLAIASSCEE
jgi:hypothetical protein